MRFMIMIRANKTSEAGTLPDEKEMAPMVAYHEELAKAGVLVDASGLQPSSRGFRIRYRGGQGTMLDGPFAESKELIAGYTLIEVNTREEGVAWARRFPAPFGVEECEIEVRALYDLDDLHQTESVERFREIMAAKAK